MREFHEIGLPGGKIIRAYRYSVSFNGKVFEDMFLTDDEVGELREEFGAIIE